MRKVWQAVRFVCILAAFALVVQAGQAKAEYIDISARAAVVMDADTGEIIIAKNMHKKLPPASTTKVMTAILALENTDKGEWYKVSARAASMQPTKVGLKKGDTVTVEALMYSLMLKSANDSASVLAENIAGSEAKFAKMMTAKAKELGAENTTFKTASGLPAKGQLTTAYDLALMMKHALATPGFLDIVSTRYATLHLGDNKELKLKNSNKLLWMYEGAVGGKTGYTRSARECYVGEVDSCGRRLIVSVLGSEVRWDDLRVLLDKGFELAEKGETLVVETKEPAAKAKTASAKRVKKRTKAKKVSGRVSKKAAAGSL